jgi:hypothetical protein
MPYKGLNPNYNQDGGVLNLLCRYMHSRRYGASRPAACGVLRGPCSAPRPELKA